MLKELLWGTPEEIQADQRLRELGKRNRLSAAQKAELPELNHLSRRLFLRRGGTVVAGAAVLASPIGAYVFTHPEVFQSGDDRFFNEISQLPTNEQVKRIDDYYSKNKLNVETARVKVLPIWVKNYIENSGSSLTPEQVLPNIILFTNENRTPEQAQIQTGIYRSDARENYRGPIEINFSTFESNKMHPSGTANPLMPGVVLLRTELTHELTHYDTIFRPSSTLGKIINDYKVYDPPIEFADRALIEGFFFVTLEPNNTAHTFFHNFNETATDVIMSYILDRGGHPRVFGYEKAEALRQFLDWVGFPPDKFIKYYQNSDLEGAARELGEFSNRATSNITSSDEETIAKGLKVMKIFHTGQPPELEAFFPGTMRNIFEANPAPRG